MINNQITEVKPSPLWPIPYRPGVAWEMVASTMMEPLFMNTKWPKIRENLEGCTMHVKDMGKDGVQELALTVTGLDTETAALYNDVYAKAFCKGLAGCFNVPIISLTFQVKTD